MSVRERIDFDAVAGQHPTNRGIGPSEQTGTDRPPEWLQLRVGAAAVIIVA
jgi:hypothetical protein